MSKKNIILRVSLFTLIFLIIFIFLNLLVYPKDNKENYYKDSKNAYGVLAEEDNTLDGVVFGSSHAYSCYSPLQAYDTYGFTSYVCSNNEQKIYQSYELFKKVIKKQNLKFILIDATSLYYPLSQDVVGGYIPLIRYHNRLTKLNKNDFLFKTNYNYKNPLKGFRINKSRSIKPKEYNLEKTTSVNNFNPSSLNKIYKICSKKDIELIMYAPVTTDWLYSRHNAVKKWCKKKNVSFWDFNLEKEELGINYFDDMKDEGYHMNYYGAVKVTSYIGKYINEKYKINHKGDTKYSSWEKDLANYNKLIAK